MNIIFCSDPLNNKKIDPDWVTESEVARNNGLTVYLVNYDALRDHSNVAEAFKNIVPPSSREFCIYRGWMMPPACYELFYNSLLTRNLQLINNPVEYKHCYYFSESYSLIEKVTPQTILIDKDDIRTTSKVEEALKNFGSSPIVIKDYVKSQKHHWFDACYIPCASDFEYAYKIINKFLELQGGYLEGGILLRKFVELESIGNHPKSKMPLTMEYRIFVLYGSTIAVIRYWEDGNYSDIEIPVDKFSEVFKKINSNFYTVDIAKQKNGDWIIIELGDAQVAEYMDNKGLNRFYQEILKNKCLI